MKRVAAILPAQAEIPQLPGEMWELILFQQVDRVTLSAVFLLNKAINAYLRNESELVATLLMLPRLNAVWAKTCWFICKLCNEIHIDTRYRKPNLNSDWFCPECYRECPGCKQYYTRDNRYFHKECAGYPAPFTPEVSDDEEDVLFTEESFSDDSWIEEEVRRIMEKTSS